MRKLGEIQDKEAFVVISKIIKPIKVLIADKEFMKLLKEKKVLDAVELVTGRDADIEALMDILAALDGVERKEYHVQLLELPKLLLSLVNDEDLMSFFQ